MTGRSEDRPPGGHAGDVLLAAYVAGTVDGVVAWSIEAHLNGCGGCRSALSELVDPQRLARNRSALLVRAAIPDHGPVARALRRCGVPDHLLRLLAVTPSLRLSWLLAVGGVLALVTGETALVRYGPGSVSPGLTNPSQQALAPFLLVAPLLVLAGVAGAFLPLFDPAYRLTVAAPFSGFTLLLIRTVSALVAALIPVVVAACIVPGPGWLPVALLLPSLALCALALAAATLLGPVRACVASALLWAVPVLLVAVAHLPLLVVQWHGQAVCAAVLLLAAGVAFLHRDRFDLGWTR